MVQRSGGRATARSGLPVTFVCQGTAAAVAESDGEPCGVLRMADEYRL